MEGNCVHIYIKTPPPSSRGLQLCIFCAITSLRLSHVPKEYVIFVMTWIHWYYLFFLLIFFFHGRVALILQKFPPLFFFFCLLEHFTKMYSEGLSKNHMSQNTMATICKEKHSWTLFLALQETIPINIAISTLQFRLNIGCNFGLASTTICERGFLENIWVKSDRSIRLKLETLNALIECHYAVFRWRIWIEL